jgi:hypothetical protein
MDDHALKIVQALLGRWALLGLIGQLLGAILITYGFRISPDSGAMYHLEGRAYPYFVLRAVRPWAYRLGWSLVVIGTALQMVPEVISAIQMRP